MRVSSKLLCLMAFAGVAGALLAVARGEQPETDARRLESAVDRLGLLAARAPSTDRIKAISPAPTRRPPAPAPKNTARQNSAGKSAQPGQRSTAGKTNSRPKPVTSSRRPPVPPRHSAADQLETTEITIDESSLEDPIATATDLDPVAVEPGEQLTSEQEALRARVRKVLKHYYPKQLNTRDHNPWEVMHGIIAFGVDTQLRRGGPQGEPVNAIAYLSTNGRMNGLQLLSQNRGRINAEKGVKLQGHYGQLLAILAQSRVKTDYPLRVNGKTYTLADLIETEQLTCRQGIELTFKLISFAHYLDSDATWTSETGETWDIPKLIAEELKQPILSNAACGGTHRLMGFAYAVRNRKKQDRPIDGQWLRAAKYLDDYHRYTFALQNSDGSFSTEWFRRREAKDDINRRLQTTGHILEWMVYSLPEEQLDDPRLVNAVRYLSGILLAEPNREWEIGPQGHALHALSIYDQRRFAPLDEANIGVARSKPSVSRLREPVQATDGDDSGPLLMK